MHECKDKKQRHLYLRDNFNFFLVFQQVVNDLVEVDFLCFYKVSFRLAQVR